MIWLLAHSAASACPSAIPEPYYPTEALVWPPRGEALPTDGVLLVERSEQWPAESLSVLGPNGSAPPVTRYDLTDQITVLVPDAPLAPGDGYEVATVAHDVLGTFDVVDGTTPPGSPAIPVNRDIASATTEVDSSCPDDPHTFTEVLYRLCAPIVLPFAVLGGDTAPPDPTLDAPPAGAVYGLGPSVGFEYGLEAGLVPGWSGTVWLGGFDGAGRFVGWTADPLTMPPAGTILSEHAEGYPGGLQGSISVTGVSGTDLTCPTDVVWEVRRDEQCDVWVDSGCPADPAAPSDSGAEAGCGCASPSGGGWLALGALSILGIRRRR